MVPDLLGDVSGLDLVTELADRLGWRPDPDETRIDDGLCEVGVLGEESVAGMDGVHLGLLGHGEDLVDVKIRLGRSGAVEGVGLVGQLHEEIVGIGVGIDGDAGLPGVTCGADDSHGDLATVRDEDASNDFRHQILPFLEQ